MNRFKKNKKIWDFMPIMYYNKIIINKTKGDFYYEKVDRKD